MKIQALHVDSFGIFRDLRLMQLPRGLVLFQGDNEAGKSTLLWFLRGLLFGFPDGRSRDPRYVLADSVAHGGRIEVVADNGDEYTIARHGTRGSGELVVADSQGVNCGEETLRSLLGSTTVQLYRSVYAFSLAELHSLESLQAEGVRGAIYGAAAGTALLALPQALRTIDARLEEIYRPRGQKQEINQRLAKLESIAENLRGAFQGIGQFDEACAHLEQSNAQIIEIQNTLSSLRTQAVTWGAYLQLWPEWITWQDSVAALADLPTIESFPENGLAQLDAAEAALRARQEHMQELEEKRAMLVRDAAGLNIDSRILAEADRISDLVERRTQYSALAEDLPLKRQQRAGKDKEVAEFLRRLGPDWTEAQVRHTDCSVAAGQAVRGHADSLRASKEEVARAEQDVMRRQETHQTAAAEEELARQKAEQYADLEPVDEALARELQNGRTQFRDAAHDLPVVEADLNRARAKIEEGTREIDARWTLDEVGRFDVSMAAQRKVQEFARRFEEVRKALDRAESRRAAADELLRGSRAEHTALTREIDELPEAPNGESLMQRKAALRGLRDALQEHAQWRSETQHLQSRLDDKRQELARLKASLTTPFAPPRWLAVMFLVMALVMFVVGLSIGKLAELGIPAVALAVLGGLGLTWSRVVTVKSGDARRAHAEAVQQVRQQTAAPEADLEKRGQSCADHEVASRKHAATLSLPASPSPEQIRTAEDVLERDRDALEHRERVVGELRTHTENVQRRERELTEGERIVKKCDQELEAVNKDWRAHLSSLGLAPDSAVETIHLIFAKLSALRDQIAELQSKEERIERMRASRDNYEELARRLPALAPHCDGAAADLLSAVDSFFETVRKRQEHLQERQLAQRALAEAHERTSTVTEALRTAREVLSATEARQHVALESWASWLGQHGLETDLSPDTALEALRLVDAAVKGLTERQQLDEAIAELRKRAEAYEAAAASVFAALQRRVPEAAELPSGIADLGRELEGHKQNTTRQQEMQRQEESLAGQIESAGRQVGQIKAQIAALLKEGHASDVDTFREHGNWYLRRKELRASIDQSESTMRRISGVIDLEALKTTLAGTSREQIEARRQDTEIAMSEAESRLNELRDAKADLTAKIEGMKTADTVARLRADEERVRGEIQPLALQWARLAIARRLLLRARKKFEEEQQPKVVRDASEFFAAMTCGRYAKIIAPVGADTLEVITAEGERRKPEELSCGTAEQLYLALRFGYIRLRSADHEPLPVVMDDILVNFDPPRAAEAAKAILKLANEHQVLFFTCHPETVERFSQQDNSVRVHRLQARAIAASLS